MRALPHSPLQGSAGSECALHEGEGSWQEFIHLSFPSWNPAPHFTQLIVQLSGDRAGKDNPDYAVFIVMPGRRIWGISRFIHGCLQSWCIILPNLSGIIKKVVQCFNDTLKEDTIYSYQFGFELFLIMYFQCHNKMALECGIDDCNTRVMTKYLLEYGISSLTVVLDLSIDSWKRRVTTVFAFHHKFDPVNSGCCGSS